jgi:hypothetical protein
MTKVSISGPFSKRDLRNEGWLNHWQFCILSEGHEVRIGAVLGA